MEHFSTKDLEVIVSALWFSKISLATDKMKKERIASKIHKIILDRKEKDIVKTLKEIKG